MPYKDPEKRKEYHRQYQAAHYEHYKVRKAETQKMWRMNNLERAATYSRTHRKRHPEKTKARGLLGYALRSGRIIRPVNCEKCLLTTKVEAHHFDYQKPLEVLWVCKECHEGID